MWILSGSRQRHPTTTSTLWWHCRCRSATAYSSDNKCPLSSQLTSISEGRSPIRHLGRRLVAGSSAPTRKEPWRKEKEKRCRFLSAPLYWVFITYYSIMLLLLLIITSMLIIIIFIIVVTSLVLWQFWFGVVMASDVQQSCSDNL